MWNPNITSVNINRPITCPCSPTLREGVGYSPFSVLYLQWDIYLIDLCQLTSPSGSATSCKSIIVLCPLMCEIVSTCSLESMFDNKTRYARYKKIRGTMCPHCFLYLCFSFLCHHYKAINKTAINYIWFVKNCIRIFFWRIVGGKLLSTKIFTGFGKPKK